jgi:5-methyltetrahydrofolate--homocysteine methyltransferase
MTRNELTSLLHERILILDGAMGTMIQTLGLGEEDYRGKRFAALETAQKGNNDLLTLTRPEVIAGLHRQYLEAGADIITTNTFNANAVSQADYGLSALAGELNREAARLAKRTAEAFMAGHPERRVLVAGSIGPTNKTASMSPDVSDPAFRAVSYAQLKAAYKEQIAALVQGGVDFLLFETIFDTLNVKAALEAAMETEEALGCELPLSLSVTLSGQGGRTFSGQTLDAFLASVAHAPILSVGLNCSFGAADMKPWLEELARKAPYFISAYPNAGLPNSFGGYDETPDTMEQHVRPFVEEGLVNILGGCCGTTPAHIARFPALVAGKKPHRPAESATALFLSGLERVEVKAENNFLNIGERCNVAGSRKFLRLIREGQYEEALGIARKQVDDGAQMLDINMDDGLLDGAKEMCHFLNLIAAEPDIARLPLMIDSSNWEVIEQGLMCIQGKSVVNSISLKEGEAVFLDHARRIRRLGAATVVMAFDEKGQADTFERKTEVCARAYRLLTEKVGFPPSDIIFDPNVLAIATGMEAHDRYALDFIRATAWIKAQLPGAKVSGGISNLSFAFRGNNYLREAMHAVFLYHAIRAGLDMGIVNPAASVLYEDIEPALRDLLEDLILYRRPEAAEELMKSMESGEWRMENEAKPQVHSPFSTLHSPLSLEERLTQALVRGKGEHLEADLREALTQYPHPVDIIDGPLMAGMNKVGELFGAGKMFLPQVVKTARTMKQAVAILQPALEADRDGSASAKAGKILLATVKGDVHDIGKNIVGIVFSCNNYEVVDLGVMVPAEDIVAAACKEQPDLIGLSGLITPSLEEMARVIDRLREAGIQTPVLIGGATTSKLHTALKLATRHAAPVVHVHDAAQAPLVAAKLLNPAQREAFLAETAEEYAHLRQIQAEHRPRLVSLRQARSHPFRLDWAAHPAQRPRQMGVHEAARIPVNTLLPYINWKYFFAAWKLRPEQAAETAKLKADALRLLARLAEEQRGQAAALYGFFPAQSEGDDLVIGNGLRLPMLRQQAENKEGVYKSLADYLRPAAEGEDYIGAFVVTAGGDTEALREAFEAEGDSYQALLLQTLLDRLAEAAAEYLHEAVRRQYWGYAPDETLRPEALLREQYVGIRPAVGYPSLPDQRMNFELDRLLGGFSRIGVSLTENGAMSPTATVSGLYFAHPQAAYFLIGRIDEEQVGDYAARRGLELESARSLLSKQIG